VLVSGDLRESTADYHQHPLRQKHPNTSRTKNSDLKTTNVNDHIMQNVIHTGSKSISPE